MPVIQTNSDAASERADAVAALSVARALIQAAQAIVSSQSTLGKALTGVETYQAMQSILHLAPGSDVLGYSATLDALADLPADADQIAYFTGANTLALAAFPAFARSLLAGANATVWQGALGLLPGQDVQRYDDDLAALAGLPTTSFGRSLLTKADGPSARTALGAVSAADVTAAIAQIVGAAPTTLDTLVEIDNALNNDPNFATTVMTALAGKQAQDADLDAIATQGTVAYGRALLLLTNAAALTAAINAFTGDAGTGGVKGLVPAPASGDAAALKFLRADGTWAATPTAGSKAAGTDLTTGTDDVKFVTAKSIRDATTPLAITYAATINPDLNARRRFTVTPTGSMTVGLPQNLTGKEGEVFTLDITFTGANAISFHTAFDFMAAGTPTTSSVSGKRDSMTCRVLKGDGSAKSIEASYRKAA